MLLGCLFWFCVLLMCVFGGFVFFFCLTWAIISLFFLIMLKIDHWWYLGHVWEPWGLVFCFVFFFFQSTGLSVGRSVHHIENCPESGQSQKELLWRRMFASSSYLGRRSLFLFFWFSSRLYLLLTIKPSPHSLKWVSKIQPVNLPIALQVPLRQKISSAL